jgi:hypothetical protein
LDEDLEASQRRFFPLIRGLQICTRQKDMNDGRHSWLIHIMTGIMQRGS